MAQIDNDYLNSAAQKKNAMAEMAESTRQYAMQRFLARNACKDCLYMNYI